MNTVRAVVSHIAAVMALTAPMCAAKAQRTTAVDDQLRAAERARAAEQRSRDSLRLVQAQAARVEMRTRLNVMSTPIPGMPFIKPNTIVVTRSRVVIMYMEPDVTVPLGKDDRYGYYVWRWNINEGGTAISLVLASDTAMRSANFGDIVKGSRVRRCRSIFETSALACAEPIDAFVSRQGQGFRIEVSDSAVVNAVHAAKPHTATGLTFVPTGRAVAATLTVLYVDENGKFGR